MSEAPELKPCPFCGGHDISTGIGVRYAECRSCDTLGPTAHYPTSPREAWNTRSDLCDPLQDERVRGMVEAAKDMHDILDKPDQSDAKQARYHYDWHKVDDAISAFRAALAALEQGGG